MDKTKEILNYLLSSKNLFAVVMFIAVLAGGFYFSTNYLSVLWTDVRTLDNDIVTSKETLTGLEERKKAKDLEEKRSMVKFDKVPVKIFKPSNPGLPAESASIDFVSTIISMLSKTNNDILDISYKIDPLSENDKISMPSTVSVVQLVMTLNGSYTSFMDFVYTLYNYDYLATIKVIKVVPLKENKNILEINVVLWLYVTR